MEINSKDKYKVLFWVPGGMPLMLHFEGAVANALKYRGVEAHAVICDGAFKACARRDAKENIPISAWAAVCTNCKADTSKFLDSINVSYSYIGNYITPAEQKELWETAGKATWNNLDELKYDSVAIGKNARSSIIRYLQGEAYSGDKQLVIEYAFSALMCAAAAKNSFTKMIPDKVVMSHGIYVDWGPALQVAFSLKIPLAAWMSSYLSCRFYFRHVEDNVRIDFHRLSEKAWNFIISQPLLKSKQLVLEKYLADRYLKKDCFDLQSINNYTGKEFNYKRKYGLSENLPVWGVLCHLNWDAVSDYSQMAYESFDDWITETIREISENTSVQWLIKIHPVEPQYNPENGTHALINKKFPQLPGHIKIIPADETALNPLDFFQLIDGAVTVYGTAGLELVQDGKPVILAGEAHYAGKGFTYDGYTTDSYTALLRNAQNLPILTEAQVLLGKKYAYSYFIQRQVPFPAIKDQNSSWWAYQPRSEEYLHPKNDVFTDFICDKILDGDDFIMSDKLVELSTTVYNATLMDIFRSYIVKTKLIIRKLLPKKLVWILRQRLS